MICIGHRGAMGHEPENTLLSIRKALDLGAHWIEVDIYAVEGRLVVIHDDRLDRTTNGKGFVSECTFEYLRSLDAGKGQKIPTLQEVFDLVDRRAGVNIEMKGSGTAELLSKLIKGYVSRGWSSDQIRVSSFDSGELKKLRDLDPEIDIGILISSPTQDFINIAHVLRISSIHCSIETVTKEFVEETHRRGFRIFVFTVNESADIERMRSFGVDGIFTDYPERVAAVFRKDHV